MHTSKFDLVNELNNAVSGICSCVGNTSGMKQDAVQLELLNDPLNQRRPYETHKS